MAKIYTIFFVLFKKIHFPKGGDIKYKFSLNEGEKQKLLFHTLEQSNILR